MIASLPLGLVVLATVAGADQGLEGKASWQQPTAAEVKVQVDQWLAKRPLDEATRRAVDALWAKPTDAAADGEVLDRLAATVALVEPAPRELVALCRSDQAPPLVPQFPWLTDPALPPLVRHNLRLYFGRWLAQQRLYDESLAQLQGLQPADVVDPATLLFYQSIAFHRLLQKEQLLATVGKLLEHRGSLPRRYETLGRLMEADLKPLKPDSLDEVSRLMDDVERRLGLGRAGRRVRQQEDDVIAKLDKMIKEIEERRKQQAQQAGAAGGAAPSNPMPDSMPGGGSGPGEVDPKRTGSQSGWGNLPPKERQEVLQQISKGLPAHYRDVIEEYFRKLAREGKE